MDKKKVGFIILAFITISLLLIALLIRAEQLRNTRTQDAIEDLSNEVPLTMPNQSVINAWEGEWMFFPEGHEPVVIVMKENEVGKLVGAGDGWLIVLTVTEYDYANAVITNGADAWAGAFIPGILTPFGNLWATLERP